MWSQQLGGRCFPGPWRTGVRHCPVFPKPRGSAWARLGGSTVLRLSPMTACSPAPSMAPSRHMHTTGSLPGMILKSRLITVFQEPTATITRTQGGGDAKHQSQSWLCTTNSNFYPFLCRVLTYPVDLDSRRFWLVLGVTSLSVCERVYTCECESLLCRLLHGGFL